jgi:hypothetical protein
MGCTKMMRLSASKKSCLLLIMQLHLFLSTPSRAQPGSVLETQWTKISSPSEHDHRFLDDGTRMEATSSNSPSRPTLSPKTTVKDRSTHWAVLFPLLSMSSIMWAIRKHGRRCCSVDTVFDDTVPSEIVVESKEDKPEDIELQHVPVFKAKNQAEHDPVNGLSMLNCSDWTEDDISKDNSFNWMENGSTVEYLYMKD